jgi:hypothetical protein
MIYRVLLVSDLVDKNTGEPIHRIVETTEVDPKLALGDQYPVYLDPSSQTPIVAVVVEISRLPAEGLAPEEQRIYVEAKELTAVTEVQNKDARMTENNMDVKRVKKEEES